MEVTTKERKRDGGIEAPAWWPPRALAAKADRGLRHEQIAAAAARILGVASLDQSRVSRCLSGSTATLPLLDAISVVLGIPSPVYLAETEEEAGALAVALAAERRRAAALAAADAAIDRERASVKSLASRQTGALRSGNGGEDRRSDGGVAGRRRGTGPS